MAVKTTIEQLEEVQSAITKVLEAQSAGVGDKNLQRARLDFLGDREEKLLARYRAEQGKGGIPAKNRAIPRRL